MSMNNQEAMLDKILQDQGWNKISILKVAVTNGIITELIMFKDMRITLQPSQKLTQENMFYLHTFKKMDHLELDSIRKSA